ncbi:MAG: hypothetical protein IPH51_17595 [Rubrivivax sp.]|nr:hypothetical protein [Rubrivivax sp.]
MKAIKQHFVSTALEPVVVAAVDLHSPTQARRSRGLCALGRRSRASTARLRLSAAGVSVL